MTDPRDPAGPAQRDGGGAPSGGWLERGRGRARQAALWAEDARTRHRTIDVSFAAADRDKRIAAGVLAGGLAFRFFFWLLPVSLIIGGVLGFTDAAGARHAARELGIAGLAADEVGKAAAQAEQGRWWLLAFGAVLLLWTGAMAVRALELTHAVAWHLPPRASRHQLRAALVFAVGALALSGAGALVAWLKNRYGLGALSSLLLPVALVFLIWLGASWWLPRAEGTTWRDVVPGSILLGVGAAIVNVAIGVLLLPKLSRSTALYGGLGLAATFLFWLYFMGRLLVASAILNSALWDGKQQSGGTSSG